MRMWMINPTLLCRKHLLGEHSELHKFLPSLRKGHKVDGRFSPVVQIQFQDYARRHDCLAAEMLARGFNHQSPLKDIPDFMTVYPQHWDKLVDLSVSIADLIKRCPDCKKLIEGGESK